MKIFIYMALAAIVFSSCAIHVGTITGDASISKKNFKMVGMAEGTATTTKIFGLGGLRKDALVNDAKKDLLQNNPLKDGQALANVTLDFKNSFILFVNKQKATVSADIIEFNEQTSQKPSAKIPVNNSTDNKPIEKSQNVDKSVVKKTAEKKAADSKPDKISNTTQPTERVSAPETIKSEKAISPKTQDNPTPPAAPSFEPTTSYSTPSEIVTSSGERFKVEAGDYFIGTLDEKGNPENGKLYDKNGRPKHVILPRRNH